MAEENKQEEVKEEVVSQEEVQSEEQPAEEAVDEAVEKVAEEVQEGRPERNWKAEMARKDAELARLRAMAAKKSEPSQVKDPNDLNTWGDHELKAVLHSNDPQALPLKPQIEEILMDRRIAKVYEKREAEAKKIISETRLSKEYPQALDPQSDFALKMEEVIEEYGLSKSPAGRLAAAKIVASDMKTGSSNADAKGRKAEANRVARVKGQMVDGDRSKSVESSKPKKQEDLLRDLNTGNSEEAKAKALGEILKSRGMTRESFFKR